MNLSKEIKTKHDKISNQLQVFNWSLLGSNNLMVHDIVITSSGIRLTITFLAGHQGKYKDIDQTSLLKAIISFCKLDDLEIETDYKDHVIMIPY